MTTTRFVCSLLGIAVIVPAAAALVGWRLPLLPGRLHLASGTLVTVADYRTADQACVPGGLAACRTGPWGQDDSSGLAFKLPAGIAYSPKIIPARESNGKGGGEFRPSVAASSGNVDIAPITSYFTARLGPTSASVAAYDIAQLHGN